VLTSTVLLLYSNSLNHLEVVLGSQEESRFSAINERLFKMASVEMSSSVEHGFKKHV